MRQGAPKRMKKFGIGLGIGIAIGNRNRLLRINNVDSDSHTELSGFGSIFEAENN